MNLVTLSDVNDAADRIAHAALRTPLIACPWADAGRPLTLKPELLQVIGSFKIRGAVNALAQLDASVRARGVVAYSSGNHAQAVAWAAKELGVPAHIVMPEETPSVKVDATRRLGAEVVLCDTGRREQVAAEIVAETGGTLIPPFDHPHVIAGQGTIGVEIVEDLPEVDVVLVPVSGGGLASGIAVAVKTMRPGVRVYGVEPALAADARASLKAGHRVDWSIEERNRTIADALRSQPSELTFAHLSRLIDGIVAVSEDEMLDAIRTLALDAHLVAEPGGAAAVAAYLHHADELTPGHVVAVVSGGNIDPEIFARAMGSGGR
jgi:threo-3-hydroxy-L-aspartate ammonia-lyase